MRSNLHQVHRRFSYTMLALVVVFLAGGGCLGPLQGTMALREAQDTFNQASRETNEQYETALQAGYRPEQVPPESPKEKYQRVIDLIDHGVLPHLERDDLRISAYAVKAYACWQIGRDKEAKAVAEEGLDRYARAGLTTNRRDYGMLLILPGLVDYSEAYRAYEDRLKTYQDSYLPLAEARQLTEAMAAALRKIDDINARMPVSEPIVIYANSQQLRIIRNILDVWEKIREPEVRAAAGCEWSCRGEKLWMSRFPGGEFVGKKAVSRQWQEIEPMKKPPCACPPS